MQSTKNVSHVGIKLGIQIIITRIECNHILKYLNTTSDYMTSNEIKPKAHLVTYTFLDQLLPLARSYGIPKSDPHRHIF